jgi:WXG100 family type VII secretion target
MNIKVTPQELRGTASRLQAGSNQINGILGNLQREVAGLADMWQGVAHEQYKQYYDQWDKAAKQLNEALHNLSILTSKAADEFERADQEISRMFQAR